MGIDYEAVYGVGYEIEYQDLMEDEDSDEFGELFEDTGFEYRKSGNFFSESPEEMDHFIFLEDVDILDGTNLVFRKNQLDKFLSDHGFRVVGEFGVHGGHVVW
jgi:hypothetical protein